MSDRKFSESQQRLLRLADHIEDTDDEFDMRSWQKCICGHAHKLFENSTVEDTAITLACTVQSGARILGITNEQARELFNPEACAAIAFEASRTQAARVLRHLACTGKVEWSKHTMHTSIMDLIRAM